MICNDVDYQLINFMLILECVVMGDSGMSTIGRIISAY